MGLVQARLPAESTMVTRIHGEFAKRCREMLASVIEWPWVATAAVPWPWTISVETAVDCTVSAVSESDTLRISGPWLE